MSQSLAPVNTRRVAELNDAMRASLGLGQDPNVRIVFTAGLKALIDGKRTLFERVSAMANILRTIRDYADWGDDPWGERDLGGFTFEGTRCLWKIDYHDLDMQYGAEQPDDPAQTIRVLTVMLASDW